MQHRQKKLFMVLPLIIGLCGYTLFLMAMEEPPGLYWMEFSPVCNWKVMDYGIFPEDSPGVQKTINDTWL